MSSKLAKKGVFGTDVRALPKVGTVIRLPYDHRQIASTCTVVMKTTGEIEVAGPLHDMELTMRLLRLGMVKVKAWHEAKQGKDESLIQPAQHIPPGLKAPGEGHA